MNGQICLNACHRHIVSIRFDSIHFCFSFNFNCVWCFFPSFGRCACVMLMYMFRSVCSVSSHWHWGPQIKLISMMIRFWHTNFFNNLFFVVRFTWIYVNNAAQTFMQKYFQLNCKLISRCCLFVCLFVCLFIRVLWFVYPFHILINSTAAASQQQWNSNNKKQNEHTLTHSRSQIENVHVCTVTFDFSGLVLFIRFTVVIK